MRGIKDFNFPAFHEAAKELRAMGHEVFSPAEKDEEIHGKHIFRGNGDEDVLKKAGGPTIRACMLLDCEWICKNADAICLMEGWETSTGATAESALGRAIGARRFVQTVYGWLEINPVGAAVTENGTPASLGGQLVYLTSVH